MEKIRVLVVDDSALMRKKISDMINSDRQCEVIATARNGEEAIKGVLILKPDVVTLDVQMPMMDGLTCLGYIMSERPTPVIMLSAFTHYGGEVTMKALEYGAVDFVHKPSGVISLDIGRVKSELLTKIKMAVKVDLNKLKFILGKKGLEIPKKKAPSLKKLVAIAGSTGGPRALVSILPKLPQDIPAGIIVVQHMPAEFTKSMAERLNWESMIEVKEAEDGEPIEPGKALVAPGGFHLTVETKKDGGGIVKIIPGPKEHYVCPSADVALRSIAPVYGRNVIGVVLTGMGSDGTEGLRAIKGHGGYNIAEDESTCIVYGMPKSAIQAGVVDKVVPLHQIAKEIVEAVNR